MTSELLALDYVTKTSLSFNTEWDLGGIFLIGDGGLFHLEQHRLPTLSEKDMEWAGWGIPLVLLPIGLFLQRWLLERWYMAAGLTGSPRSIGSRWWRCFCSPAAQFFHLDSATVDKSFKSVLWIPAATPSFTDSEMWWRNENERRPGQLVARTPLGYATCRWYVQRRGDALMCRWIVTYALCPGRAIRTRWGPCSLVRSSRDGSRTAATCTGSCSTRRGGMIAGGCPGSSPRTPGWLIGKRGI